MSELDKAKQVLIDNGYYVGNLWNVEDVFLNYNCTDEEAQEILHKSINNHSTIEHIFECIDTQAKEIGLIRKYEF